MKSKSLLQQKKSAAIAGIAACLSLLPEARAADVKLNPPKLSEFQNITQSGSVEFYEDFENVISRDGRLSLPLRVGFQSAPSTESANLGLGFKFPLFESTAIPISEKRIKVCLPCGRTMTLFRKVKDPTTFNSLDGVWTGILKNDTFTVSRPDGWTLSFLNGHLSQIRTDKGNTISWVRSAGKVIAINDGPGNTLLSAQYQRDTGLLDSIQTQGGKWTFAYDKRPRVAEVAGVAVVTELKPGLTAVSSASGKHLSFEFVDKLELSEVIIRRALSEAPLRFVWNPINGEVRQAGNWDFKVIKSSGAPTVIERTDPAGAKETYSYDYKNSRMVRTDEAGDTIITTFYRTRGPLYGKIRSVVRNRGNEKQTLQYISYGSKGERLRETDVDGRTIHYGKDELPSKLISRDGKTLFELTVGPKGDFVAKSLEEGRVKYTALATDTGRKDEILVENVALYSRNFDNNGKLREFTVNNTQEEKQ